MTRSDLTYYQAIRAREWPPAEPVTIGPPQPSYQAAYEVARADVSYLSRAFYGVRLPSGECVEMPTADLEAAQEEDLRAATSPGRVVWG